MTAREDYDKFKTDVKAGLIVRLDHKQADFLLGLFDCGGDFIKEPAIQMRAKDRHLRAMRGTEFVPMTAHEIDNLLYGRVLLIQRAHTEDGQLWALTACGRLVAMILADDTYPGGYAEKVTIDGTQGYEVYEGTRPKPEELKIPITAKHLQGLLQALMGPGHLIRELQATMSLPKEMTGEFTNPLREVLEEYNAFVETHTKKG